MDSSGNMTVNGNRTVRDMEKRKEEKAFDYAAAVAELEKMASQVESADVSIDDIDKYIKRSDELISGCRKYLRSAREKLSSLDTDTAGSHEAQL